MGYEPLHHKYRPQTFAQLVGQSAIATTLSNALGQQRIAPAYLFSGPRGTGKTSSARILAKSLNCISGDVPTAEPCGVCEVCKGITDGSALDVIEIDAASNTGVDNIRELIERAQFAPVQCRYKVYIIDEVHMLSTAAFNALLKTLEEPPDRVVFVLATTDPQRVLPTIISRCQRFDFRRIALPEMIAHLSAIAQKESINIADDALQLVAQVSQGGLRDAESLLDQLSLVEGQIIIEKVWDLVGAVPERDLLALVKAIAADNGIAVLDCARHLMDRGREPLIVLQNLAGFYRDLLIAKTAGDRQDLVAITPPTWKELCAFVQTVDISTILLGQQHLRESEVQVKNTTQPRLWLEVTLMGLLPSALHPVTALPSHPIAPPPSSTRSQPPLPTSPHPPSSTPASPGQKPVVQQAEVPSEISHASAPAPHPAPPATPPPPVSTTGSSPSAHPMVPPPQETTTPYPTSPATADQSPATPLHTSHSPAPTTSPSPELVTAPAPPQAPTAPPAAPPPAYTKAQLEHLWQQVTALVKPPIAQTLFQQQGRLIDFNGNTATVAIKSKQLMRLAEQRIEKLTVAFQNVLGHSVRVVMEVARATSPATAPPPLSTPPVAQATAAPPAPAAQPTPLSPPVPPSSTAPNTSPSAPPQNQAPTHTAPPSPTPVAYSPSAASANGAPVARAGSQTSAPDIPPPPISEPTLPPIQNEDAETQSVKRFANMFNGEIVDLDDRDLELLPPIRNTTASEPSTPDAPSPSGTTSSATAPTNTPDRTTAHVPPPPSTAPSYDPDVPF